MYLWERVWCYSCVLKDDRYAKANIYRYGGNEYELKNSKRPSIFIIRLEASICGSAMWIHQVVGCAEMKLGWEVN